MVTFFQIEAKKILKTNGHRSIDRLPQKKKLKIERFVQKMRIFFFNEDGEKKVSRFSFCSDERETDSLFAQPPVKLSMLIIVEHIAG